MKSTDYAGIDYGLGKSNINAETGIRYGVISQNSAELNPDAIEDIYQHGRDLSFEQYQQDIKDKLRSALSDYFSDVKWGDKKESKLDIAVNDCWEVIEENANDQYEGDGSNMLYESDGYKIQTTETEFIILESPYFTRAQYCSPCFPGAGNLNTYCVDGPKTYCLGHDWFEGEKAPYPVFSVKGDGQICA